MWRNLKPRDRLLTARTLCLWRRKSDDYVFMGSHDYVNVFRDGEWDRPVCAVGEARWCIVPCDEIPIERP